PPGRAVVRADPGADGHSAALRRPVAGRLAWAPRRAPCFALLRAARPAGGGGLLRAGFLRRHREGQLPLAAAGLPRPAAAGTKTPAGLAALAAEGNLGSGGGRAGGRARLLRGGVGAPAARAGCGTEVVPVQLCRLGRAGRRG